MYCVKSLPVFYLMERVGFLIEVCPSKRMGVLRNVMMILVFCDGMRFQIITATVLLVKILVTHVRC